ncbi:hypothetical protein GGE16_002653 [Rhizobium leguminosarum]|uniref:Uncharacterized protein n=1 Tax=Rhizobium leguminosarum TaxID=384 RepID=A0AAE2MJ95_RHILE|nr:MULTISPECIES: hypothetical protein [Rhizobium]MBB4290613.1 hypothetical protein [Rhizobium leguminosarum]MBB4297318.1 hypothetical protein [Rhizobium leguminosarum]MBB4307482.1 hypothetical protein [Rhizobium leguminosarum]MBB4415256.1 hypothetical protein [Rhizobium leguminosarum]MBB4431777.1 hypothetical protein [Rhizobium esperanzae]
MTLVLAFVHPDRVEILTDRAAIDPNGVVVDIAPKVRTRQHPTMAVAGRGRAALLDVFAAALDAAVERHGFDGGLSLLGDLVAEQRALFDAHGADFELLVAGISETSGLGLWALPSHNLMPGMPAWRITKAPIGFNLAMGGKIDLQALIAKGASQDALVASFYGGTLLPDYGVVIAETMREASGFDDETDPERFGQCTIGGGVDLTTVTATSVETTPLRIWSEDLLGRPIRTLINPSKKEQVCSQYDASNNL